MSQHEPDSNESINPLIAAAPDLLAALKLILDGPGNGFGHPSLAELEQARAAIAKAEGK